jgi:hypothetical protein
LDINLTSMMTIRRTRCMMGFHAVLVIAVVGFFALLGVTGAERTLMQYGEAEAFAMCGGLNHECEESRVCQPCRNPSFTCEQQVMDNGDLNEYFWQCLPTIDSQVSALEAEEAAAIAEFETDFDEMVEETFTYLDELVKADEAFAESEMTELDVMKEEAREEVEVLMAEYGPVPDACPHPPRYKQCLLDCASIAQDPSDPLNLGEFAQFWLEECWDVECERVRQAEGCPPPPPPPPLPPSEASFFSPGVFG